VRRNACCIQPEITDLRLQYLVRVKAISPGEAELTGRAARQVWARRIEEWMDYQAWLLGL
jgi:hypothetical protein